MMQDSTSNNPVTILVADDEPHIVRVVSFKLKLAGFEVISATNGQEAWEILCENRVDLLLTDHQMPFMTGLELAKRMGADPRTASIPVLMLTARGFRLTPIELQGAGIVEVLDKPFSPRMLLDAVLRAIGDGDETIEREAA